MNKVFFFPVGVWKGCAKMEKCEPGSLGDQMSRNPLPIHMEYPE